MLSSKYNVVEPPSRSQSSQFARTRRGGVSLRSKDEGKTQQQTKKQQSVLVQAQMAMKDAEQEQPLEKSNSFAFPPKSNSFAGNLASSGSFRTSGDLANSSSFRTSGDLNQYTGIIVLDEDGDGFEDGDGLAPLRPSNN